MTLFIERLKSLRKSTKTTQKEISYKIGVSERNYQDYEYGKVVPSATVLFALAEYFEVSIDYLVGRTDNPNINK